MLCYANSSSCLTHPVFSPLCCHPGGAITGNSGNRRPGRLDYSALKVFQRVIVILWWMTRVLGVLRSEKVCDIFNMEMWVVCAVSVLRARLDHGNERTRSPATPFLLLAPPSWSGFVLFARKVTRCMKRTLCWLVTYIPKNILYLIISLEVRLIGSVKNCKSKQLILHTIIKILQHFWG